ncbi:MAG TPA: NADH-quinone oxidoreductase subunit NuoG, partial [Solirubrobacterales bacterium]|nr:NADH-quinone oxidoreductase subunit NuoG [Solirubrobacterales bacterium]
MKRERNPVTLVVDGIEVTAPEGTMLVDAAKQGDVEVPVFCYEPKLGEPVGACRMCLVEVEGIPKLQTACSTPVRDGMVVYTQTERVKEAQSAVVEFLLVNHPLDCPVCDKGGECPLQDIALGWGPGRSRVTDPKRHFQKPLPLSPLIKIDRERCILCYRCVRFSQEVAEDEQLQLLERGDRTFVGTFDDRPYVAPFHGNIIELCPVGALTSQTYRFRARPWDIEDAGSICTLCPSQCNVKFTVRDEHVVRVLARDNHAVDDGWLCDKGRFGYQMLNSNERVTEPLVRAGGALKPASWDDAIAAAAAGLNAAREHSAALVGGGASNEEGYLVQRLLRGALGASDVNCSSRGGPDVATLRGLADPKLAAGLPDLDGAGTVLVIATDPLHEMPILDLRIRKAVRRLGVTLAVASERPTTLDGGADAVARFAPGAAPSFLSDLAAAARGEGSGAGALGDVAAVLGVSSPEVIVWGSRLVAGPRGADAAAALLDLAAALRLGEREGSGLLEVPEHANGRGLREAGCTPGAGPGLTDAPAGKTAPEIRTALESDELKALLLADVDPIRDFPDGAGWEAALQAADFVVAFSMFENDSTAHADVVFPAESHAEKEGTVTHPDGRLQRLRPNVPHPGDVRPGWQALVELSAALGHETGLDSAPEVFEALASEAPFLSGLTYEEIGGLGIRWQERQAASSWGEGAGAPSPDAERRPAPPTSETAAAAPGGVEGEGAPAPSNGNGLRLGTYRDLWSGEITERNPSLRFLAPEQQLELAPSDAERLGVEHGQTVSVSSNGTSLEARVAIRERMRPGAGFLIE